MFEITELDIYNFIAILFYVFTLVCTYIFGGKEN